MALAIAVLVTGCKPEAANDGDAAQSGDRNTPAVKGWSPQDEVLVELPEPDLSALEAAGREEVARHRTRFNELVQTAPNREALGRLHGKMGMFYHAYEFDDLASKCFANAATLEPTSPKWRYYIGQLMAKSGQVDKAILAFSEVLQLINANPNDALREPCVATCCRTAEALIQKGRLDDAQHMYESALKINPSCFSATIGLGTVALKRSDAATTDEDRIKHATQAIKYFEEILEIFPNADGVNYPMGLAYRALGDLDRAEQLMSARGFRLPKFEDPWAQEVVAMRRTDRAVLSRAGRAFNQGNYKLAEAGFRRVVESNPDDIDAVQGLAATLVRQGRLDEGLQLFERALEIDPASFTTLFSYGSALSQADRDEDAVVQYGVAIKVNPKSRDIHLNLGNALFRLGRIEEAANEYATILGLDPSHAVAMDFTGICLIELGRYKEALEHYNKALVRRPDDLRLMITATRLLAACPDESICDPQRALEVSQRMMVAAARPNEAQFRFKASESAAMAHARAGEFDQAKLLQNELLKQFDAVTDPAQRAQLEPWKQFVSEMLERYNAGQPANRPWFEKDPWFWPSAARSAASNEPAATAATAPAATAPAETPLDNPAAGGDASNDAVGISGND